MRRSLWLIVLIMAATISFAQRRVPRTDPAIQQLIDTIQQACETRNSALYASLFTSSATWNGPVGENAIGPDLIAGAVGPFLDQHQHLRIAESETGLLAPNLMLMTLYQRLPGHHDDAWPPTGALGIGRMVRSDVRTTLLLENSTGNWRVAQAWVADLRKPHASEPKQAKSVPISVRQ